MVFLYCDKGENFLYVHAGAKCCITPIVTFETRLSKVHKTVTIYVLQPPDIFVSRIFQEK